MSFEETRRFSRPVAFSNRPPLTASRHMYHVFRVVAPRQGVGRESHVC